MAVTLTIAGTSYSYPSGTDTEWGSSATTAMQAVASNAIWKDGSVALTANWDVGDYALTMKTITLDVADGTAPMTVTSKTKVDNLQAASVEGTGIKSTGESGGTKYLREDGDGTCSWQAVSVSKPELSIDFPAGTFDYPSTNPAPLNTDVGTNNTVKAHLFDDSTDESVEFQIVLPSDLDTSGTVTFECIGYSGAASPSGNTIMAISQVPKTGGEVWDAAYTTTETAAADAFSVQDQLEVTSWTETVANLGWSASDFVKCSLFRDADNGSDTLTGDYSMVHFRIRIPRT